MKALLVYIMVSLTFLNVSSAYADDLIGSSCVAAGDDSQALQSESSPSMVQLAAFTPAQRSTCETLRKAEDAFEMGTIAFMSVQVAMKSASVRAAILADPAIGAAIVAAGPETILAVTVIGAIGVSVVYLTIKLTEQQCRDMDKEELKEEILKELKVKFPQSSSENATFQFPN